MGYETKMSDPSYGATPLEYDEIKGLIPTHITTKGELAARFQHRLVSIHPFSNGNGRHARLMADLILEKIFNKEPFSWGKINLATTGDVRGRYIEALKKADDYDYGALFKFVRS